jgi:hypothetical protein
MRRRLMGYVQCNLVKQDWSYPNTPVLFSIPIFYAFR